MSATTADWSGIDGSGFDRSEVRHQIALSEPPRLRRRLLSAAEIGLSASSVRAVAPEEAQQADLRPEQAGWPRA